jgi:glycerol-3-phosphate acyltransferase PlsY
MVGVPQMTAALSIIAIAVIARHHVNIRKLLSGTESRIGQKATSS